MSFGDEPHTSFVTTSGVQFSFVGSSAWLLSYNRFHKHNNYMPVLCVKFNGEPLLSNCYSLLFTFEWASKIWQGKYRYVILHTCPADNLEEIPIWIPV